MRLLIVVSLLALLVACGPAGTASELATADAPPTTATAEPRPTQAAAAPAPASVDLGPDAISTASGLQYVIVEEGSGPIPMPGQIVQVHYVGTLADGTQFDSSRERGQPFQFALGSGQVIAGWDEGFGLLREGSTARLVVPPELGYGEQGAGGVIPGNATLIFDVELVQVLPPSPAEPMAVAEGDYTTTASGLKYYDAEEGSGAAVQAGQTIVVQFTAWLGDGAKLGSSLDSGQPLVYQVGSGQLFPGLEEGLASMRIGGSRQLIIPPELAFGETGTGGIPPNSTLIFEVEVQPEGQ